MYPFAKTPQKTIYTILLMKSTSGQPQSPKFCPLYCSVLHCTALQCIVPQQVRCCLQFCIKPRSWMWGLDMRIRALLCGQRQQQGRHSVTSFHLLAFPVTCHVICSCILVVTILWKPGTCYLFKVRAAGGCHGQQPPGPLMKEPCVTFRLHTNMWRLIVNYFCCSKIIILLTCILGCWESVL